MTFNHTSTHPHISPHVRCMFAGQAAYNCESTAKFQHELDLWLYEYIHNAQRAHILPTIETQFH